VIFDEEQFTVLTQTLCLMEQIYINSELNLPHSQNCIQHITQFRHKLDKIQQIPRHNISGHFERMTVFSSK
jgi:hypothetical protein